MFLLILFAAIAIGISFICSVLEAALLSLSPSYVASLRDQHPKRHAALAKLKDNIDKPLAAILTLNTIAHTVGATGVGAQVSVVFGEAWVGVASAVMTLLILVASEIIPKTIGATYWRQLSPMLPGVLNAMVIALKPLIWLSELITSRIGKDAHDIDVRGEIKALAQMGLDKKALENDEQRVITNILNLHEMKVRDVLTPRPVCQTVSPEMSVAEFNDQLTIWPFSRYPVMTDDERTLGMIHRADAHQAEPTTPLKDLMRPISELHAEDNVEHAFGLMQRERQHLCVVYDNLGNWLGVITLEDVMETILGEDIIDETDNVANLRRFARQRWTKRIGANTSSTQPAAATAAGEGAVSDDEAGSGEGALPVYEHTEKDAGSADNSAKGPAKSADDSKG
ncbi:CNNM domain-containing protein [Cobetia sp. 1CM21F]|uniref:CNNM domain-containing protein n=1 Tax=Cobetia sp. 1CM21F TaxID=2929163 RepID=UPI0020BF8AFE|nr:CNNM domain-containing protein [Cobetia sp. 1CM21F]MCK8067683.1 CNNM domain-containing protein [Cobetia sp. 1CM21F]